jgi:hypothetical protein
MGTLTLNIIKSIHLSISPIILHKLYSTATPEYPRLLLQENYVFIVALAPDLLRVCFYDETDFVHQSSTFQLLLFPKHIKRLYLSSKASTTMREIVISHVAAVRGKFMNGCYGNQYVPRVEALTIFGYCKIPPTSYNANSLMSAFGEAACGCVVANARLN